MTNHSLLQPALGSCAEKNSVQALSYRIQKPNSNNRTFAFIIHADAVAMFEEATGDKSEHEGGTCLYLSGKGFVNLDDLFLSDSTDFFTFICSEPSQLSNGFISLLAQVDRWMHDRFITTIICASSQNKVAQNFGSGLVGRLRKISSQLVWVDDAQDLKEVLSALQFFR